MYRREYKEHYGEYIGRCIIHGTILGVCDICENEAIEWVSQCCEAFPMGELDESTIKFGGPSGFCSNCHDNCTFMDSNFNY